MRIAEKYLICFDYILVYLKYNLVYLVDFN